MLCRLHKTSSEQVLHSEKTGFPQPSQLRRLRGALQAKTPACEAMKCTFLCLSPELLVFNTEAHLKTPDVCSQGGDQWVCRVEH